MFLCKLLAQNVSRDTLGPSLAFLIHVGRWPQNLAVTLIEKEV